MSQTNSRIGAISLSPKFMESFFVEKVDEKSFIINVFPYRLNFKAFLKSGVTKIHTEKGTKFKYC